MAMQPDARRILILGTGNILLSDEGFGVYAAHQLEQDYCWPKNVRILDGGTLGLLLMAEFMESDLVIILDIARLGEKPGTFYKIEGTELTANLAQRQSAHQTGIADTLICCELAGHRPETLIFAMEPFSMNEPGVRLTPAAEELLPAFCARVVSELADLGIHADPRS